MPGTVLKGQLSSIEETLSASIGGNKSSSEDLARKLASQSRSILLQKIQFVSAVHESSCYWKQVAEKYCGPSGDMNVNAQQKAPVLNGMHKKLQKVVDNDGLPAPKVVLYDRSKLQLAWRNGARKGCGLQNTHNTCFMNSVLQALTYTPAYNNYLSSREHSRTCENRGLCMICVMEEHIRSVSCRNVWTPWPVIKNLRSIAKHFSHGRQEDAHEFLRYFIESMTKSALLQHSKLDVYSKNTTALHQIFGGYLRSQVKCSNCEHKSNTFDPMLDVALDIKDVSNLHQALESFTKPESLHGENCYSCERCKKKVKAIKRFTIHQAPNVLTIQLKRFDMAKLHSKVNKPVNFPATLNIRNYMSSRQGKPVTYTLYAVLVHSGACASFGHYYTYARVPNGQWYLFNDSHVSPSSIESVLRQQAYILFYSKEVKVMDNHVNPLSPLIGPVKKPMAGPNQQYALQNGILGKQNGDMGLSIPRKIPPSATAPKPPTPVPTSPVNNGAAPVPQSLHVNKANPAHAPAVQPSKIVGDKDRQKISFGIKPKTLKNDGARPTPAVPLVMKIKDGKVVSNTASPPDTHKNTIFSPGSAAKSPVRRKLVPYNEDNTSSSDNEVETINGSSAEKSPGKNGLTNGGDSGSKAAAKRQANGHGEAKLVKPKPLFSTNHSKKESPSKSKESPVKSKDTVQFEPILDERLKATTEVPGSYAPLDRLQNNGFKTPPFRTLDRKELALNLSSPEPGKLNSTSKWSIVEQEQKSPSLASSTSSVNSTTEWKVRDDTTPKRPASTPQQNGAAPAPAAMASPVAGWSVTPVPLAIVKNIHCDSDVSPSEGGATASLTEAGESHVADRVANEKSGKSGPVQHQKSLAECEQSANTNQVSSRKDNGPDTESVQVNGSYSVQNNYDTSSESQISADTSVSSTSSKKTSKKKKKKDKRKDTEAVNGSASSVYEFTDTDQHTQSERKKKKKKKHKRREYEPGELSDSPEPRKRSHEGEEASDSKKRRDGFEWVERTKETREEKPTNHVPVTMWDQSRSEANQGRSWDGVRNNRSDVLSHLQQSSLQGYGPSVTSWHGGMSTLEQECANDRKGLKRSWEEEYEEQLDMGKVKKVKKPREANPTAGNQFQNYQDRVNQNRYTHFKDRGLHSQAPARGSGYSHGGNYGNFYGNHRGHQNGYHGNQHGRNGYYDNRNHQNYNDRQFGNQSYRNDDVYYSNKNTNFRGHNRGHYRKPWRGGYGNRGGYNHRGNRPYHNNHGSHRNNFHRY